MDYAITTPISLATADTYVDIAKAVTAGKRVACAGLTISNQTGSAAVVTIKIGGVITHRIGMLASDYFVDLVAPGVWILSDTSKLEASSSVGGIKITPSLTEEY